MVCHFEQVLLTSIKKKTKVNCIKANRGEENVVQSCKRSCLNTGLPWSGLDVLRQSSDYFVVVHHHGGFGRKKIKM